MFTGTYDKTKYRDLSNSILREFDSLGRIELQLEAIARTDYIRVRYYVYNDSVWYVYDDRVSVDTSNGRTPAKQLEKHREAGTITELIATFKYEESVLSLKKEMDTHGNVVHQIEYGLTTDFVNSEELYTYNNKNQLTEKTRIYLGEFSYTAYYYYDDRSNLVRTKVIDDNNITRHWEYEYDEQNNLLSEKGEPGTDCYEYIWSEQAESYVLKKELCYLDGHLNDRTSYKYDEKGNPVRKRYFEYFPYELNLRKRSKFVNTYFE